MLKKYENDSSIAGITGDCRLPDEMQTKGKYSYIDYPLIWGWATWKRAWSLYDIDMKEFSYDDRSFYNSRTPTETKNYFQEMFARVKKNEIDTWDYQFSFQVLKIK